MEISNKHQPSLGAAPATESSHDLLTMPITISPPISSPVGRGAASVKVTSKNPTLTINAVREWIFERMEITCDASEGLPDVLDVAADMKPNDRLLLLGELWPGLDRISLHMERLLSMIRMSVPDPETVIPELMTAQERAAFDVLPEQITLYRGCGPINKGGCSWTMDRSVAIRVPFMSAYITDQPMLLTATIQRSRAAALKLFRSGLEVVVFGLPTDAWTVEPLSGPPAGW